MKKECTNPNLECKIWFCATAINNMNEDVLEMFKALEVIAKKNGLVTRPFIGDTNYVGADKLSKIQK